LEFKEIKSTKSNPRGLLGIVLLFFIAVWIIWNKTTQEDLVTKHQKITLGKVTGIYAGKTSGSRIDFTYYISGQSYKGSDKLRGGYPNRIRLSKPEKGKYYEVEYDSTNHKNHRIIINREPINPRLELNYTTSVEGCVKKETPLDQYIDVYINYKVQGESFDFRTRLHKDSLNIYETEKCYSRKAISLEASKRYPFFNNLYFKSRDRQYKGAYSTEGKWNQ